MFCHGLVRELDKLYKCHTIILVPMVKYFIIHGSDILGEKADIHTGGEDLKFPHHDNEMAQVEVPFILILIIVQILILVILRN